MTNLTNLTQTVTAVIGAIVLSTAFVGASVGPVHAEQIAQITTSAQAHA
jgi:acetyl-CoA carboxylase beta subunit